VASLFQNGHELEYCEGPADLQVLEAGGLNCTTLLYTLIVV
jgi:hypothetical protein